MRSLFAENIEINSQIVVDECFVRFTLFKKKNPKAIPSAQSDIYTNATAHILTHTHTHKTHLDGTKV